MKSVIIVAMTTFLVISGSAMAGASSSSQGAKASSAAGPWVDCLLPDGKVEYMPKMICTIQKKGKVK